MHHPKADVESVRAGTHPSKFMCAIHHMRKIKVFSLSIVFMTFKMQLITKYHRSSLVFSNKPFLTIT